MFFPFPLLTGGGGGGGVQEHVMKLDSFDGSSNTGCIGTTFVAVYWLNGSLLARFYGNIWRTKSLDTPREFCGMHLHALNSSSSLFWLLYLQFFPSALPVEFACTSRSPAVMLVNFVKPQHFQENAPGTANISDVSTKPRPYCSLSPPCLQTSWIPSLGV